MFHFLYTQIFQFYGILLVLMLTVDRYIAVRKPFRYASLCTKKRARLGTIIGFIGTVIYNAPHANYAKLACCKTCVAIAQHTAGATFFALTAILLNGFIPFILLFVFNVTIICTVRKKCRLPSSSNRHTITGDRSMSIGDR